VSQDPIGLRGGLALYAYVADALLLFDPYGLTECVRGPDEKKFRQHYLDHRSLLEKVLGKKYPKWKVDGGAEFLKDLGKLIDSGRLARVGEATLKKETSLVNIFRGEGVTLATKALGADAEEFVTLLKSGVGEQHQEDGGGCAPS
jgi:hypothetical protein